MRGGITALTSSYIGVRNPRNAILLLVTVFFGSLFSRSTKKAEVEEFKEQHFHLKGVCWVPNGKVDSVIMTKQMLSNDSRGLEAQQPSRPYVKYHSFLYVSRKLGETHEGFFFLSPPRVKWLAVKLL